MAEQKTQDNTQQEQAQEEEQQNQLPSPKELLRQLGGPSDEEVEKWKHDYGDVKVSIFSTSEVYLFRPLRRSEYRELQTALQNGQMDQMAYEDKICETCVLWPSPFNSESRGGTASTLSEQVMQNSNFVAPQFAAEFVFSL